MANQAKWLGTGCRCGFHVRHLAAACLSSLLATDAPAVHLHLPLPLKAVGTSAKLLQLMLRSKASHRLIHLLQVYSCSYLSGREAE